MDKKKIIKKLVAVIIVGTNDSQWLMSALGTLTSSTYKNQLIIYVDNDSSDGSVKLVKKNFPDVTIIENNSNLGFAAANNRGIDLAYNLKSDYIFFVNPDTKTPPDLVDGLVEFMEAHKRFGAIGPLQLNYNALDNSDLNKWSLEALKNGDKDVFYMDLPSYDIKLSWKNNQVHLDNIIEHFYVQGAALFIRTKITGFKIKFDPIYHTFYEEIDLCRKIRWLGYRVGILSDKFINHQGGGSTSISNYKKLYMMRNKYIYIFTEPTWEKKKILLITSRWINNDLRNFQYRDLNIYLNCFFSLIINFPKIIHRRLQNAQMTRGKKTIITKMK